MVQSMQEAQLKVLERKYAGQQLRKNASQQNLPASPLDKGRSTSKPFMKDFLGMTHAYVSSRITWDDNVASLPEKKGDIEYVTTPGIKWNSVALGKSTSFDLHLETTYYLNRDTINKMLLNTNLAHTTSLGPYTLSFRDSVETNAVTTKYMAMSDNGLDKKWTNGFSVGLGRNFNRCGFDLDYVRADELHDTVHKTNNNSEDTVSFSQYLRIGAKTRLVFDYSHDHKVYPGNPGSSTVTTTTTSSTGIVSTTTTTSSSATADTDTYGLVLTGVLSPKVSALGGFVYKPVAAKNGADTADYIFTSTLGYRVSDRTGLSVKYTGTLHDAVSIPDRYDESVFALLGNHRLAFNPKLTIAAEYDLDFKSFTEADALDGYNHESVARYFSVGMSYSFKQWLDFSLAYLNKSYHSNFDSNYTDNQVTFSSQARF